MYLRLVDFVRSLPMVLKKLKRTTNTAMILNRRLRHWFIAGLNQFGRRFVTKRQKKQDHFRLKKNRFKTENRFSFGSIKRRISTFGNASFLFIYQSLSKCVQYPQLPLASSISSNVDLFLFYSDARLHSSISNWLPILNRPPFFKFFLWLDSLLVEIGNFP